MGMFTQVIFIRQCSLLATNQYCAHRHAYANVHLLKQLRITAYSKSPKTQIKCKGYIPGIIVHMRRLQFTQRKTAWLPNVTHELQSRLLHYHYTKHIHRDNVKLTSLTYHQTRSSRVIIGSLIIIECTKKDNQYSASFNLTHVWPYSCFPNFL